MSQFAQHLQTYGVLIVFGNVLLTQVGLPVPAFPVLIAAGALAFQDKLDWALVLGAAVAASVAADYFWFRAGRFYGKRILRLLCRISLSPDSCVGKTEDKFHRYSPNALVVAKFIPGFNTVAPPLAGAMGTSTPRFLVLTAIGGLLWSAVGVGIGAWFHDSVDEAIALLGQMGNAALQVLLGLLALFIMYKFIERRRLLRKMDVPRIGMRELKALIDGGHDPVIIDARGVTARKLEPAIPGAVLFHPDDAERLMSSLDKQRHIIVYCSCPNDVTAAQVAKQLHANGFLHARALQGGLHAWTEYEGGTVNPLPPVQPSAC